MGWLKEQIRGLYEMNKGDLKKKAAQDIYDKIKKPDRNLHPVKIHDLQIGRFYFLFYDLAGKSSKMEQYSPVLLVDIKKVKTKLYAYGLCFNFIPANIRILYFDKLLDRFQNTIQKNLTIKDIYYETPLQNINFEVIYKTLLSTGFEYSIREFDITEINTAYLVATQYIPYFIIFDTQPFTGVDEGKLVEIWQVKIKEQTERHKEIMSKLQKNYNEMEEMFKEEFKSIKEQRENMEKSIDYLNKLSTLLKK